MRKFIISAVVAAVAAVSFAAPSQAGHYGYKSYSQKHHGYKKQYGYKKHYGGQYGYKKHHGYKKHYGGSYGYNSYNSYNGLSFSFGYY